MGRRRVEGRAGGWDQHSSLLVVPACLLMTDPTTHTLSCLPSSYSCLFPAAPAPFAAAEELKRQMPLEQQQWLKDVEAMQALFRSVWVRA